MEEAAIKETPFTIEQVTDKSWMRGYIKGAHFAKEFYAEEIRIAEFLKKHEAWLRDVFLYHGRINDLKDWPTRAAKEEEGK